MGPGRRPPPRHLAELALRAGALEGRTLGELARALAQPLGGPAVRTKGQAGRLVERALGAASGSRAEPDFAALGVELKTVPVDGRGVPRQSTFVCRIALAEVEGARWEGSVANAKLSHLLLVPIGAEGEPAARRIGAPRFVRPTPAQERVLRADFEELVGALGVGEAEAVTAHRGRWLQVRPKAAHGAVRALAPSGDGGFVETVPRGFYLRRRFVAAVLLDPAAMP
jgi:DNA mismatch repair protein MutH